MHEGHRERVYAKLLNETVEFSDLDTLELLLFYAIPQKDVRPIANELLLCFGSLENVINAPYDSLAKIKGMGKRTAVLIRALKLVVDKCKGEGTKTESVPNINTSVQFFRNLYDDYSTEKMIVVFLNEAGKVLHKMEFTENINDGVRFELDEISLNIAKVKPYACIVAHNHPSGDINPSNADDLATKKIITVFNAFKVKLFDHIIITRDSYYSYAFNGRITKLNEEILNSIKGTNY